MRATVIRHVPFEDLGAFAPVLEERGFALRWREAGLDAPSDDGADLLVVLGGPIGAYEEDLYPFLADEIRVVAGRLDAGQPTLGICLGAQIMARAAGARVYPSGVKEIGWSPLTLTDEGAASPLRHLGAHATQVLHWHGDTFDLPAGATLLASTPACRHQAFALGATGLGLQFHPEVTAAGLERWFIGHACEIASTPGVTVPGLRAATAAHAGALERQGRRFLESWLDGAFDGRIPANGRSGNPRV